MRVLHVTPSIARSFGGPTQALLAYLEAGRRAGIEGDVVSIECPAEDQLDFVEKAAPSRLDTFPARGIAPLERSRALERHVGARAGEYDVVHVHGLLNLISSLGARAARAAGKPLVIRPFGTLSRYTFTHRRRALKRAYFALLDAPLLRSVDAVHFTTGEEAAEAAWLGIDFASRSWVIPPSLRTTAGEESGRDGSRGTARVLFLGRLHPKKGIEALLDAWPAVRRARPDATLVIAGSGAPEYTAALEARVMHSSHAADGVAFAGFVTGVAKQRLLADSDLFVLPSRQENFGVAVLEAVAAGLPVVVTPEVQLASWIGEHGVGRISARTPAELGRTIVQALGDAGLRRQCAASGPVLVRRHFTPEVVGSALAAMYTAALDSKTTGDARM